VSRRQAIDEHGSIEYACIKSCVGNVVHSIIDMSHYSGPYLPGFSSVTSLTHQQQQCSQHMMHSIDHVAIAMTRGSAQLATAWYERVLGLKRFAVHQ
jgi:4-hydroxyphenylpyruvate dioxygenase-like putative hemolysin